MTEQMNMERAAPRWDHSLWPARGAPRRLIHYSSTPLREVQSRSHDPRLCGFAKTPGLWVSAEGPDDWPSFCLSDQFALGSLATATEVVLRDNACVLWLKDAPDIDGFTENFVATGGDRFSPPDWPGLRQAFQGLVIAPYVFERRLSHHAFWYYGWDCASGVLWDASAILELKPIVR